MPARTHNAGTGKFRTLLQRCYALATALCCCGYLALSQLLRLAFPGCGRQLNCSQAPQKLRCLRLCSFVSG